MPKITRRPSIKMQRLARELVRSGNGADAAIRAGYQVSDRHHGAMLTSDYLTKPIFKSMVLDELQKQGVSTGVAISVLNTRMLDNSPQTVGVQLKAALEVIRLWKECTDEPSNGESDETHQILKEPLEVRRWFLLSGRMPTEDERKLLSGLKNGEAVNPDLLAKMLSGKK